jgi:hypothetical protein
MSVCDKQEFLIIFHYLKGVVRVLFDSKVEEVHLIILKIFNFYYLIVIKIYFHKFYPPVSHYHALQNAGLLRPDVKLCTSGFWWAY